MRDGGPSDYARGFLAGALTMMVLWCLWSCSGIAAAMIQ